nr:Chain C, Spike protein S2 [Severe acute respiratory syndrome coronavirus 2]
KSSRSFIEDLLFNKV